MVKSVSDREKDRIALIEGIQKISDCWRATAEAAALSSVRKLGDKEALSTAHLAVVRHDERQLMADQVIQLVRRYWPDTKET